MKLRLLYIFICPVLFLACSTDNADKDAASEEKIELLADSAVIDQQEVQFNAANIIKTPSLDGLDYLGNVVNSYSWKDQNGTNYLINTIAKSEVDGLPAANIYSYHYIENSKGNVELLRLVQDYEDVCDFDITLEFLSEPTITDLNGDNYAEVSVVYRKACRSDVSECDMKLIMHDQNGKYGLRGAQFIVFPDSPKPANYQFDMSKVAKDEEIPEWLSFRGRYKNANDFENCDPSFFKLADSIWQANAFESFD